MGKLDKNILIEIFDNWIKILGQHMARNFADIQAEKDIRQLIEKVIPDNWTPTSENINALPESLRKYICDLETNTDPAGLVQENVYLKENCEALQKLIQPQPEVDEKFIPNLVKKIDCYFEDYDKQRSNAIATDIFDALKEAGIKIEEEK